MSFSLFSFKDLKKSIFTSLKFDEDIRSVNLFSYSFVREINVNLNNNKQNKKMTALLSMNIFINYFANTSLTVILFIFNL